MYLHIPRACVHYSSAFVVLESSLCMFSLLLCWTAGTVANIPASSNVNVPRLSACFHPRLTENSTTRSLCWVLKPGETSTRYLPTYIFLIFCATLIASRWTWQMPRTSGWWLLSGNYQILNDSEECEVSLGHHRSCEWEKHRNDRRLKSCSQH